MSENAAANAVRAPSLFSEAIQPTRTMVVDTTSSTYRPIGLGNIIARHTLYGKLTGYVVALDTGTRITVTPDQISSPQNIITAPPARWVRNRPAHPLCPLDPMSGPAGAA